MLYIVGDKRMRANKASFPPKNFLRKKSSGNNKSTMGYKMALVILYNSTSSFFMAGVPPRDVGNFFFLNFH